MTTPPPVTPRESSSARRSRLNVIATLLALAVLVAVVLILVL